MNQTPFAFMGSADSGWDPTLGGTFSVQHHWDWTDQNTMTFGGTGLSGSQVATITDKVGNITMTPVNGPSGNALNIGSSGSYDTSVNATYLKLSPYQYQNGGSYNWLPNDLNTQGEFTVVMICYSEDWGVYVGDYPRSMWYCRSNASNGYDNLNQFMMTNQTWLTYICSGSGISPSNPYGWGMGVYNAGGWGGADNQKPQMRTSATPPDSSSYAEPSVYSTSFSFTDSSTYRFQKNAEVECTLSRATSATAEGEGLTIGGAPIGFNQNNCFQGHIFHFVVYDQATTQSQRDSIYQNWAEFYAEL